jgi:hypothetical protein
MRCFRIKFSVRRHETDTFRKHMPIRKNIGKKITSDTSLLYRYSVATGRQNFANLDFCNPFLMFRDHKLNFTDQIIMFRDHKLNFTDQKTFYHIPNLSEYIQIIGRIAFKKINLCVLLKS